jgi:hypothetical protein
VIKAEVWIDGFKKTVIEIEFIETEKEASFTLYRDSIDK